MMRDITLGQYFPGTSVLHRSDPRMKLILTLIFIVFVFLAKSLWAYVWLFVFTFSLLIVSRLPVKVILKGLKPVLFIIAITVIFNLFLTKGEDLLFEWKFIHIYFEGVMFAVYMIIRIVCLILGTSVILTYTTSPVDLTDGIEQLLSPLKKIKIPVHEFAMMMSIALRFIPTLTEETEKIMNAQKARGADLSSGGLIKRAKALIPILIPLFVSSLRRADELATAMECRCYRGGDGRTRMKRLKYSPRDLVLFLVFAVFGTGIILLNIFLPYLVI